MTATENTAEPVGNINGYDIYEATASKGNV